MKNYPFIATLVFCILSGCNKHDEIEIDVQKLSYPDKIVMGKPVVRGDSIELTWSKLDNAQFSRYLIIRKESKDLSYNPEGESKAGIWVISSISNKNTTRYIDKNIPACPYLEYQIIGRTSNNDYSYDYIFSNSAIYERPNIKLFDIDPLDVIPDFSRKWLYLIESKNGRIQIINYETLTEVKTLTSNATIGYCSIGKYNGNNELYVPRNDGWIFIYNPETLALIDKIDISVPSSCIVNNEGKLFISTSPEWNYPLRVYDRATKQMITKTGWYENTRLRLVPGTKTDIFEVTINIWPVDQCYYRFNATGGLIYSNTDQYHGDYPLDHEAFQFFPDGKKYITGSVGAIYNIDMTYIRRLQSGNYYFSSFEFNQDGSVVYCGCSKSIMSFSTSDCSIIKTYSTLGYPYKLFRDGNTLICISLIYSSITTDDGYFFDGQPPKVLIEKIML